MAEKETLTTRVTRLEDKMIDIADTVKILLDAQVKTETIFQEIRKEAEEREKRMDERIGNLVSAIGELIRRQDGM